MCSCNSYKCAEPAPHRMTMGASVAVNQRSDIRTIRAEDLPRTLKSTTRIYVGDRLTRRWIGAKRHDRCDLLPEPFGRLSVDSHDVAYRYVGQECAHHTRGWIGIFRDFCEVKDIPTVLNIVFDVDRQNDRLICGLRQ